MMRRFFFMGVLMLVAIITACSPASSPAPTSSAQSKSTSAASSPTSQVIKVEAFDDFFRPEKITIAAGTQVTWVNVGKRNHTITYQNLFDVDIKPGETFTFTFDKAGTYQYYCVTHSESDHDGMVGTVTVTEKK
jgi:plastocyanin